MVEKDSHYTSYPASYTKNKRLMDIVKKHDDPLRFILDVLQQMSSGKLKLKIVGAASTREVAALWNDYNNKKITPSMMESIQLNEGKKVAGVMWKDDMDFDNPEIQIFGLGVYTLKTLRKNISMKLEDLSKRVDNNWGWVWEQINNPKAILHDLVNALQDVEEELNTSASKRKITMMKRKR
tara:strand:+ start:123 stop:665 length:543 start_codon:yes stop_codon:yes gene_type:complete